MDYQKFYRGQLFTAYEYLGAHPIDNGFVFRVFAPGANSIQVIGEWNDWKGEPMEKIYDGNFWEAEISGAEPGMMYKYRIDGADGRTLDRCDPYGFMMEKRPGNASILWNLNDYLFTDKKWMKNRTDEIQGPLNIYEIHFGSWRRKSDAKDDWYGYDEMAELLVPYLKKQGYNYVEIMPLAEHPVDESWGYQNTGFFSPTSRYGTPTELMAFVDECHKGGIGVIMDFVPVHFAVDDYALWKFDGTDLYSYPSNDVGVSEWGSCNFMHSRPEVRSFLQSSANYWLEKYHFDGLRMDAVSNLLFWQGDESRGKNLDAIEFLKNMNSGLKALHPTALLAAEDSSSYPGVTKSVKDGGLGFDYKWDMGWMHDTLELFQTGPEYRTRDYHKLTFSMQYFYNEKFLLPLSHDEVVHGKATIVQKMYGDYDLKFPQARTLYIYMMTHPGKKLNFMGNEFAQFREWDEKREQDWLLLDYPIHDGFRQFMADLNHIYLEYDALWKKDYDQQGFHWVDCHSESRCVYSFLRTSGLNKILVVMNLSDQVQKNYRIDVNAVKLTLLIDSDNEKYGGKTKCPQKTIAVVRKKAVFDLPPFSARIYKLD